MMARLSGSILVGLLIFLESSLAEPASPGGQNAFSLPLSNITRENRRAHVIGNSFFNKNWVASPASTTARDGLGPLFLARSCSECHLRDGRSRPEDPGLLFRIVTSENEPDGSPKPDSDFGSQIATRAIPGFEAEGSIQISYAEIPGEFADGTTFSLRNPTYEFIPNSNDRKIPVAPRIANPVFGLGLLEAIPESSILSRSDPDDANRDGISGRGNRVWDTVTKEETIGRFGWKANQPSIRQQTASAFLEDIGITSSIHPHEALTKRQLSKFGLKTSDTNPELDEKQLDRVILYLQTLAPPARRRSNDPEVQRGEALFLSAGCGKCHIPEWKTGPTQSSPAELADQLIFPYTDLLLHDMGPELADNRPDFTASGSEWRTPPLWGIGLTETVNGHTFFLHDGRARNLEEAILWHGGEAIAARETYRTFSADDREAVLAFLNSL